MRQGTCLFASDLSQLCSPLPEVRNGHGQNIDLLLPSQALPKGRHGSQFFRHPFFMGDQDVLVDVILSTQFFIFLSKTWR
jgi:hypothetical protein